MWNEPTKEQLQEIPKLYETEGIPLPEKLIYHHFFLGLSDWYIAEYDGQHIFWGFAILNEDLINAEWGYIPFDQLKAIKIAGGLFEVDNDLYWKIRPAKEVEKIAKAFCHSHWNVE